MNNTGYVIRINFSPTGSLFSSGEFSDSRMQAGFAGVTEEDVCEGREGKGDALYLSGIHPDT